MLKKILKNQGLWGFLIVCSCIQNPIKAQSPADSSTKMKVYLESVHANLDFKKTISIEPFLGGSLAYATGNFIDYQKSFHGISEQGTTVDASIQPILMATAGVQARYNLFKAGAAEPLQFIMGLQYQQKGFNNFFKATYASPENYTDITQYQEQYRLHYLLIPIQLRWGHKWFGELGTALNFYLNGTKTQKLHREQSGAGTLNGGFSSDLNQKFALNKTLINKTTSYWTLGGGYQWNERNAISLQTHFSGAVFQNHPDNFKNITLQMVYLRKLNLFK